jgi:chromosome segregation ATPase
MLTLESLKTEVDDLRETVRMADSKAMGSRTVLEAFLTAHGKSIDELAASSKEVQQDISRMKTEVRSTKAILGMMQFTVEDLKSDVASLREEVPKLREDLEDLQKNAYDNTADLKTLKGDVGRVDQNIGAIMHHFGIAPVEP